MIERIPDLQTRLSLVEHELQSMRKEQEEMREDSDMKHEDNSTRLARIETTLVEIAIYFKVGRWVMNCVWVLAGAAGSAVVMKWFGLKP